MPTASASYEIVTRYIAEWLEHLTANAKVETVLASIPIL
jgi:hypothetical protein